MLKRFYDLYFLNNSYNMETVWINTKIKEILRLLNTQMSIGSVLLLINDLPLGIVCS